MPAKMSESAKKQISESLKGNTNQSNHKLFKDALRRKLIQNPQRIDKILEALLQAAEEGDLNCAKEILDRSDGKSVAIQEISGPDGNPIEIAGSIDFAKNLVERLLAQRQKDSENG